MKRLFFLALLISTMSVFAANIRDIDVGDGMYLQGIFSDELVQVVRIDFGSNRVKVRRSEDSTTKWVNPSELISRETSTGNDIVRGAAAIAVIACALNPDSCKNNNNSSSSSLSNSQSSSSTDGYKFKIENRCKHAVKLALHYRKVDGNWSTIGWWGVDGNKSRYLNFSDGSYATSKNTKFYYYAITNDDSLVWKGEYNFTLDGKVVPMRQVEDLEGESDWSIYCPDN